MIKITVSGLVAAAMLVASSAFAGDKACCAKGVSNTEKTACNIEPHTRSKEQDQSVAGGVHEGRLHQRKPENIPQASKGNSFRRAVRSAQNRVQKVREREENRDLIVI